MKRFISFGHMTKINEPFKHFFHHIELLIIQFNNSRKKTLVTVYYHDDVMQKKDNRVRQESPERTCTELETLTG